MEDPNTHAPADTHLGQWHCEARIDPSLDLMRFYNRQELPAEITDFCTLRRTLDYRLQNLFVGALSDADAKIFSAEGIRSPAICSKWDDAIIDAAGRYGTLILLSDLVLRRVHAWRTGLGDSGRDSSKLKRFLDAILEEHQVRWGDKQDPITEAHARMKPYAVSELEKLQAELQRSASETPEQVISLMSRLMTPEEYPGLNANRAALFIFFEHNPIAALGFGGPKGVLFTKDKRPIDKLNATTLFYKFVAFSTNRTQESVRQAISTLSAEIERRKK